MPLKWGTNPHDHDLYAILADAAARQRDLAAIQKYALLAQELAMREDHKLYRAIAHRALAVAHCLAGEHNDAETQLNHALEIFQNLGTRWQLGRALSEFGELELARQNDQGAHDYFSRALTEFDAMRAAPDAAATRLRLRELAL